MSDETFRRIADIEAPYGRHVSLGEVEFESGMKLLRLTLREGRRITIVDLDATTASVLADHLAGWAEPARDD